MGEHLPERALAGAHHDQVCAGGKPGHVVGLQGRVFDPAAALGEVGHQLRQVHAVVHRAAWRGEVAAEKQRMLAAEVVVVAVVAVLAGRPVVHAQLRLAFQRHRVVSHGVQKRAAGQLMGPAVGVQRDFHVVLQQVQPQVQPADAAADDRDPFCHAWSPAVVGLILVTLAPSRKAMASI